MVVPVDVVVPPRANNSVIVALAYRAVQGFLGQMAFGPSLFRLALSLLIDEGLEFKVGTIVADLYGGNPHGTIANIVERWDHYNRGVDRRMLRDCLQDRYIIDPAVKDTIRRVLVRFGDMV